VVTCNVGGTNEVCGTIQLTAVGKMADDGGRICAYDVETVQQYIRYAELRDKVQFFDRQAAKDLLAEVSTLTCVKLQLN